MPRQEEISLEGSAVIAAEASGKLLRNESRKPGSDKAAIKKGRGNKLLRNSVPEDGGRKSGEQPDHRAEQKSPSSSSQFELEL